MVASSICSVCGGAGSTYVWWDDPENVRRLGDYCDQDVEVESLVDATAPQLSAYLRVIWERDQLINDRGIQLDVPLILRAQKIVEYAKADLDRRMSELTGKDVPKATQTGALADWITRQGIPCSTVRKGAQEELLLNAEVIDVPQVVKAIEIRRAASKTSTAKLWAALDCVCQDGRARGLLHFHAAHTGRWAGRLFQPQNLYRVDEERDGADVERAFGILERDVPPHEAHDLLEMIVGEPMEMIAKCMRRFIVAKDGRRLVGGDLASIEGCVNPWLAGEDAKVQAYRDYQAGRGPDLYRLAYAQSFSVPVAEVPKSGPKRQIGKVCIAEGQMVTTHRGLVAIEDVQFSDFLWDGAEWVPHDGVVFRGVKECIEYDGLTATPDHEVFVEDVAAAVPLGTAADRGLVLRRAGMARTSGGYDSRVGQYHHSNADAESHQGSDAYRVREMPHMRQPAMLAVVGDDPRRAQQWMPDLRAAAANPTVVGSKADRSETALYEFEGSWLSKLRRAWHRIPFRLGPGRRPLDNDQLAAVSAKARHRPTQQRWALRARQFALGDATTEQSQYETVKGEKASSVGPRRVYDILNAGPRHRFAVNGRLVANCELALGYGGSVGAYYAMSQTQGINLSELVQNVRAVTPQDAWDKALWMYEIAPAMRRYGLQRDVWTGLKIIVDNWRKAHPKTCQSWWDQQDAAIDAVHSPGTVTECCGGKIKYVSARGFLWCQLPSGRLLAYCRPHINRKDDSILILPDLTRVEADEYTEVEIEALVKLPGVEYKQRIRNQVLYEGYIGQTKKWGVHALYGGLQCENNVSGIAFDILVGGMLRAEDAGYPVVLTVHDELLTEPLIGHGSPEELRALMIQGETWTDGLPLDAKTWEDVRYAK